MIPLIFPKPVFLKLSCIRLFWSIGKTPLLKLPTPERLIHRSGVVPKDYFSNKFSSDSGLRTAF